MATTQLPYKGVCNKKQKKTILHTNEVHRVFRNGHLQVQKNSSTKSTSHTITVAHCKVSEKDTLVSSVHVCDVQVLLHGVLYHVLSIPSTDKTQFKSHHVKSFYFHFFKFLTHNLHDAVCSIDKNTSITF